MRPSLISSKLLTCSSSTEAASIRPIQIHVSTSLHKASSQEVLPSSLAICVDLTILGNLCEQVYVCFGRRPGQNGTQKEKGGGAGQYIAVSPNSASTSFRLTPSHSSAVTCTANVEKKLGLAMSDPTEAGSRAKTPRKSASSRGKWSEDQLLASDKSALIDMDLVVCWIFFERNEC